MLTKQFLSTFLGFSTLWASWLGFLFSQKLIPWLSSLVEETYTVYDALISISTPTSLCSFIRHIVKPYIFKLRPPNCAAEVCRESDFVCCQNRMLDFFIIFCRYKKLISQYKKWLPRGIQTIFPLLTDHSIGYSVRKTIRLSSLSDVRQL